MMNEGANVSSGALLAEGLAIFRRNWPLLLVAGVLQGLFQFGQKVADRERLGGIPGIILVALFVILAQMVVEGVIARSVFVREGIADPDVPVRFRAYMGVSVVVLVGISLGMVLLIVPGILLALRWALAANFTLTRGMSAREALEASRDTTEGHRGEIFGAYVVVGLAAYAPMLIVIPLAGGFNAFDSLDPLSVLGAIRVVWTIFAGMAGLAMGTGIFSAFVGRHGRLQEVFA